MLTLIKSKNYFDIILISENALNTTNELTLDKFPAYNFEQFNYHTLAINITKHIMVPKHEPLDQTQKKEFLKKSGLDVEKLPQMMKDDPIARYYGLKTGTLVRIRRTNYLDKTLVNTSIYYRMVV